MFSKYKYTIPYDLDSVERSVTHNKIIKEKYFLRRLYESWYSSFLEKIADEEGKILELGSGGGFLKDLEPSIITSDILDLPSNDLTFSALDMPFQDNELKAIFMIDTFHHIPDSEKFLEEVRRVLHVTGELVMIEPASTLWGSLIYKYFHHEPFDKGGGWSIPLSGPLSGANGALPWIVFKRDYKIFQSKFPELKIESIRYHNPLMYLISGGLTYKQLFPDSFYKMFMTLDRILPALSKQFSMFMTIHIRKTE